MGFVAISKLTVVNVSTGVLTSPLVTRHSLCTDVGSLGHFTMQKQHGVVERARGV